MIVVFISACSDGSLHCLIEMFFILNLGDVSFTVSMQLREIGQSFLFLFLFFFLFVHRLAIDPNMVFFSSIGVCAYCIE